MSEVKVLCKRLKELREYGQLTQLQLAEHLQIGRASVSNYENGDRVPDADVVIKLADFFRVSTDYLLGRSEFKNSVQEYEFRRKAPAGYFCGMVDSTSLLGTESYSYLDELNSLMVSLDENYSSITSRIVTGNRKFRLFTMQAFSHLFNMIDYTGKILENNEYDEDMGEYLNFLLKLKDMSISPSDFGHFQANQTQIKSCSRFFNEFITLFVYSITDLEKENSHKDI